MFFTNPFARQRSRLLRAAVRGLSAGILAFLVLIAVDRASLYFGLTGAERFADDLLGGLIVAGVSFLDDRRRDQILVHRLQIIALMNHHVRNSLQAIKFANYTDHQVRLIDDSIARIEWALREILPGMLPGEESGVALSTVGMDQAQGRSPGPPDALRKSENGAAGRLHHKVP